MLSTVTVPDQTTTTTYEYDSLGRETTVTSPMGLASVTEYNAASQKVAVTTPGGETFTSKYDELGNHIRTLGPTSETVVAYGYDTEAKRTEIIAPSGALIENTYTPNGNLPRQVIR